MPVFLLLKIARLFTKMSRAEELVSLHSLIEQTTLWPRIWIPVFVWYVIFQILQRRQRVDLMDKSLAVCLITSGETKQALNQKLEVALVEQLLMRHYWCWGKSKIESRCSWSDRHPVQRLSAPPPTRFNSAQHPLWFAHSSIQLCSWTLQNILLYIFISGLQ